MKLIVLDATTKTIRAALAGAVATSNPDYVIAYADSTDSTFAEASTDGQLNGTTDVTLVAAPASGVKRTIKSISVYNRDTAPVIVVIKLDVSGTQRILQRVQLVSGETWHSDELTKLSPGGSDTQVQFNDLGTLAGSSNFTYNKTTSVLTLGANPVLSGGTANGVLYLNGSKVATSGSALTFNGTTATVNSGTDNTGLVVSASNSTSSQVNIGVGVLTAARPFVGTNTNTNPLEIGTRAAADTVFVVNSTEQMRLTSTGLGIGTNSPAYKLDVLGTSRIYQSGNTAASLMLNANQGTISTGYAFTLAQSNSAGNYNFTISEGATTYLTLTNSVSGAGGNLGLGVTPSAWSSSWKVMQLGGGTTLSAWATDAGTNLSANAFNDGSWKRINAAAVAQYSLTSTGEHRWNIAGSSTAGSAITFTQAMTLDASGNLGINSTSPSTFGKVTVQVAGTTTPTNLTNVGPSSINLYAASNGSSTDSTTGVFGWNAGTGLGSGIGFSRENGGDWGTQIRFYTHPTSTTNIGDITERVRITSAGNVGIGTTSNSTQVYGLLTLANVVPGSPPVQYLVGDNFLGDIRFARRDSVISYPDSYAMISGLYGSGDARRTILTFWTSDTGNSTERARITSGGYFKASYNGSYIGSTNNYHELVGGAGGDWMLRARNTAGTAPYGIFIDYNSASPNGTASEFIYCQDSGPTLRMSVRSNGGIANYSANNVNLSDRREKTNFAPAGEYLSKICAIPVQTFNYIDQNLEEDPGLTLGVVAQDVQAVAPELVMESNWGTEDSPKMRLSIYQTDLQYALMKCIQEQQAIITALTARVAALEGTQP